MIQAIRLCWRKWARTKKYRQPLLASGFDLREAKRKCWVEHESNLSDCVFAGFERSPCSWRPRDADQPVLHPVGREANRGAVSEAEHFDDRGARGDTQPLRREVLRNRQIGVLIRATRKKSNSRFVVLVNSTNPGSEKSVKTKMLSAKISTSSTNLMFKKNCFSTTEALIWNLKTCLK